MPTHQTINGRSVEYEPTAAEARFLRRVEALVDDPKARELELRDLIYGPENPLLEQQHGYSFVTPAAFESPVFRVALDLLDRKKVAVGSLDLAKAAARYTMTVAQASEQLGLGPSTVRMAVLSERMPSWMVDGEIRLDPAAVAAYEISRRGTPPKLVVSAGSHDGTSLRLRVEGGELAVTNKERAVVHGEVRQWQRVHVITGANRAGETTYRYWAIAPGGQQRRIELGDLKVVGRFTVVEQKNGKAASEAWHEGSKASPSVTYERRGRGTRDGAGRASTIAAGSTRPVKSKR